MSKKEIKEFVSQIKIYSKNSVKGKKQREKFLSRWSLKAGQ